MRRQTLALSLALVALFGCKSLESRLVPRIRVTPQNLVFNAVVLNTEDQLDLVIENDGDATLRITEITIDATPAYVRIDQETEGLEIEPGELSIITVIYRPETPEETSGNVVIQSNDPSQPQLEIPITSPRPTPAISIVPAILDFGITAVGTPNTIDGRLRNPGLAPLIVCDMQVTGNPEISSDIPERLEETRDPEIGFTVVDVYNFDTGVGINELEFQLFYLPAAPGDDLATLVVKYDQFGDVGNPCEDENTVTATFEVNGTAGTPLLGRDPCPLDFGERPIDVTSERSITLTNLGNLDLEVFDIRLDVARTSNAFGLSDVPDLPLTLGADASTAFTVAFHPGDFDAEAGLVQIEHADAAGNRVVSECRLAGVGVEDPCPSAVVEGWILDDSENRRGVDIDWALPLQTLVLDGSASFDTPPGTIVSYIWEIVSAPEDAINGIRPFDAAPDNGALAQYFLPLAGRYQFRLTVIDDAGFEDCGPAALVTVVAIPEEAIAIELTWHNPSDPDEADGEGSDVDLHLVKMPAPWFDPQFDCYFGNDAPFWNPEHPSLDIDDTDGVGPETIQMDDPENCQWYALGAHYFREAFDTAWPTVRIFINGRQIDEIVNQPLRETDVFWDIARIHWPSGTIYRVDEIIEGFDSGEGIAPGPTDAMIGSGLCGDL